MLFNSLEYILAFLPLTFAAWFLLHRGGYETAAKVLLVSASLFFYGWWYIGYVPILVGSILCNFFVGTRLGRLAGEASSRRKTLLVAGVTGNLALLGYFKYADFLIGNFSLFSGVQVEPLNLLLPLAISFFTFQQIAYLVDAYRGECEEYSLLNYAVFVSFFPQLIAGPIVHHREMMPQFTDRANYVLRHANISAGLFVFSIGLFKKVVIADTFGVWATAGFDGATSLNFFQAWATSLSYSFQLYFDFSGYVDMATGAALMFNIRLPLNFYSPYKATNIRDFWRRWHMTLSRFLRDYLYIPLGGSRLSASKTARNLMITFLLGGLWHGAGWTFVFWGFLHGLALVIQRAWNALGFRMPALLAWFMTFMFLNVTWVFFRATSFPDAIKVLRGMFSGSIMLPARLEGPLSGLTGVGVEFGQWLAPIGGSLQTPIWLLAALIVVTRFRNSVELKEAFRPDAKHLVVTLVLLCVSLSWLDRVSEFLYFNF